ncbi:FimB/Mfa2 family fimbrial subunit [Alistipes finegoldii]|uniref:FimB/Mfa2 family fimbrial subunit n=1 Tax=Alistipes finegoldii TaxID=214856 RepID=UPI00242E14E7|nr:FimB/Mfa2 family fimbrial subunit [Alistipes finegoldii]
MKLKNILCGILVCGAFCACSDQEPENSNKPGSFDGKAYLRVNITDANSTRATGGDLEYGDAAEHEVVNADFFFYDTNGIFIARANVWDSGTENEDNPAGNIEFFGKSVIVLKGLTETNHPKHLVTVLNTPEDFEPANTLDGMKTLLAGSIYNGSHFTMSTTSYGRTAVVPYFVTEVSESDFKKELDEAQNATPVDIYVERLAAKVTLRVDNDKLVPVDGKPGIYKVKVTVAGDPNQQEQGTQTGAADIYVRSLGWGGGAERHRQGFLHRQEHRNRMVGCGPRIRLERCGLVPQLLGKVLQLRQTGRQVSRRFGRSRSRRIPELHQRRQAYQTIRAVSLLRRELQHVGNRIGVSPFGRDEHPAQSADPRRERTAAGDDTLQRNALQTQRLPELRAQHASERQQAEPVLSGRRGDRKIRADRS